MSINNLHIAYRDLMKDMKAFPPSSPARKRAKHRLEDFLRRVHTEHGQETVDRITKKGT